MNILDTLAALLSGMAIGACLVGVVYALAQLVRLALARRTPPTRNSTRYSQLDSVAASPAPAPPKRAAIRIVELPHEQPGLTEQEAQELRYAYWMQRWGEMPLFSMYAEPAGSPEWWDEFRREVQDREAALARREAEKLRQAAFLEKWRHERHKGDL